MQDGGVVGTLSNLVFLLVMGVVAEQVLGAWRWLVCYFGVGLVGALIVALVGARWGPGLLLVGVAAGVVVQVALGRAWL